MSLIKSLVINTYYTFTLISLARFYSLIDVMNITEKCEVRLEDNGESMFIYVQ